MLSTVEKVLFLMRAPVTAEATTDALSRLAQIAHEVEVPIGERLFAVGDTPDALWIVLDGAVRVDGIEVSSRLVGASEVIGGLAVFGDAPHISTAAAVVTSRLLRIERGDLEDLLDEDGEFARALFSGLVRVLRSQQPSAFAP